MKPNVITDTRPATRASHDHVLTTATGSHAQRWYDAYRIVNNGTATSLYFSDNPHPQPKWLSTPGYGHKGLTYDPWTVRVREIEPYDPNSDGVVLESAERAWLRSKRGKQ
jgi:hypothetical protein